MEIILFMFAVVLTLLILVRGLSAMGYEIYFCLQLLKSDIDDDDDDGDFYREPVHDYDGGVPVGDEWRGN